MSTPVRTSEPDTTFRPTVNVVVAFFDDKSAPVLVRGDLPGVPHKPSRCSLQLLLSCSRSNDCCVSHTTTSRESDSYLPEPFVIVTATRSQSLLVYQNFEVRFSITGAGVLAGLLSTHAKVPVAGAKAETAAEMVHRSRDGTESSKTNQGFYNVRE